MKKFFTLFIITINLMAAAYAGTADLKFTPDGGGKYIYCNNNEFITREQLADGYGINPAYLMTCPDMKTGKYTLYFSHINRTELKNPAKYDTLDIPEDLNEEEEKYYSDIKYPGFAIETDVSFTADEDTEIRLTALGFEVQKPRNYYYTNRLINYEDSWGCLNALSDYFRLPIYTINSELKYEPKPFEEKTFTIKKGDTVWLSEYIENYEAVGWLKPVHLLCDFEIISGSADIKIAACRSKGNLRDRSGIKEDAAHGRYWRDGQYKGIANSLPSVSVPLEFTIDDNTLSGDSLSVNIFNQYLPDGLEVKEWLTHINPQNDANTRRIAAESDLLPIYYKDEEKLKLYDKKFDGAKNDIWTFDAFHSDTRLGKEPNYELDPSRYNVKKSSSLANYCVKTNYKIKLKNDGEKLRYFNYRAKCTSNIIAYITDSEGNLQNPFLSSKGYRDISEWDTICTYELAPKKETEFTLTVFLPINYTGGIRNAFVITDEKAEIVYSEDLKQGNVKDISFTGKNFVTYSNGLFWVSRDGVNYTSIPADENVKKIFSMDENAYRIVHHKNKYYIMYNAFAETPAFYSDKTSYVSYIYVLDESFKLTDTLKFRDGFPFMLSYAGGKIYVRSNMTWCSDDLKKWEQKSFFDNGFSLPLDNGSGVILLPKTGGETYLSPDNGENFYLINFPEGDKKPRYIDVFGDLYFYAEQNMLYTSYDGLNWASFDAGEKITKLSRPDGQSFLVNDSIKINAAPQAPSKKLILNSEVIKFSKQTKENPADLLVPAEEVLKHAALDYKFSKDKKVLTIKKDKKTYELRSGSNAIYIKENVKSEKLFLNNTCIFSDGEFLIPAYDTFSAMGFSCKYIDSSDCIIAETSSEQNN